MSSTSRKRNFSAGNILLACDLNTTATPVSSPNRQVSKKAKRSSKVNNTNSANIDNAIDAVISQSQTQSNPGNAHDGASGSLTTNGGQIVKLQSEIAQLQSVIATQSDQITRLTHQLAFVMSYLEITDVPLPPGAIVPPAVHNANPAMAAMNPDQGQSTSTGVVAQKAVKQTVGCPITARAAAVTAVYVEQTVKKRRAASVIVTGLPIVSSATDVQQFSSLCQSELGIQQPDIATAKRLGSVRPGRVQPLLVALRSDDAASHILSRARLLRQSADVNIKNNVYINPNLTRAEATAAYNNK